MPRVTPKGKMNEQDTRYGPQKLDPVKAMVAQAVQHHLVTGSARPELPAKPEEVEDVEGRIVSPLETLIIFGNGRDIRRFYVTVREAKALRDLL
jgi:hypothetical protein